MVNLREFGDFELDIPLKVEEFKIIDYPESGMVLENYISENRNIIKWLKKIHGKNEGKKIINLKLNELIKNNLKFMKSTRIIF